MSTEQEPVNYECGRRAEVVASMIADGVHVRCTRIDEDRYYVCWFGPDRTTPAAAVKAWDKVMARDR